MTYNHDKIILKKIKKYPKNLSFPSYSTARISKYIYITSLLAHGYIHS